MLAIRAGTLIDGSGAPPRAEMLVLAEAGRILDVLPWQQAEVPAGAEFVELLAAEMDAVLPASISF